MKKQASILRSPASMHSAEAMCVLPVPASPIGARSSRRSRSPSEVRPCPPRPPCGRGPPLAAIADRPLPDPVVDRQVGAAALPGAGGDAPGRHVDGRVAGHTPALDCVFLLLHINSARATSRPEQAQRLLGLVSVVHADLRSGPAPDGLTFCPQSRILAHGVTGSAWLDFLSWLYVCLYRGPWGFKDA